MEKPIMLENSRFKAASSEDYKYFFDKKTGYFVRWGETEDDNPTYSPFGPEIADIEISTSTTCSGKCNFCYKQNGTNAVKDFNMTLQDFKELLGQFPRFPNSYTSFSPTSFFLTQIAFGICDIHTNPDMWDMMAYARENGIIPNFTCNGLGITDSIAKRTAELCGAVAVSMVNKKKTFEAVQRFIDAGISQTNIHYVIAEETLEDAIQLIPTLPKKLNAIVFLQYKPKGKGNLHSLRSIAAYRRLINVCNANGVKFGFDSCSANIVEKALDGKFSECIEPCESFGMFSCYINAHSVYFPCSFCEGEKHWSEGIDMRTYSMMDVWESEKVVRDRVTQLMTTRECPIFDLKATDG